MISQEIRQHIRQLMLIYIIFDNFLIGRFSGAQAGIFYMCVRIIHFFKSEVEGI